ncbi:hypothetical protein [Bacillus sp. 1P06AnD]|uniref:hypothetical protein n=1 Tax=Bacillus sp. 1P06AnD TaxID=3132208 RepID=UPI00399F45C9
MEKLLVKTALYTFVVSFSIMLVLVDRVRVTKDVTGMYSSEAYTYPDYFFMLIRYSLILTFIAVLIVILKKGWVKYKGQK